MTHGEKGGELFAADRPYLLKDITNMFEGGHVSLVNKPKLFFIQVYYNFIQFFASQICYMER